MNISRSILRFNFTLATAALALAHESHESLPIALPALVVTAAHAQQPLVIAADPKAPAQPVPAHDGADVLKSIPGFSVIRKGGADGDPVLRGFAGSRLGIQIDGEHILGGCGNRMDPPTAYVFPAAYDRITVIKGPQTVLHGPGNSAGVVLFEREHARLDAFAVAGFGSATIASFGRRDLAFDAQVGQPAVQVRLTGTTSRADDYADGTGRSVHSAYERWSANAAVAWTPDHSTFVEFATIRSDGQAAYADRAMDGAAFARENYGLRFKRTGLSALVREIEFRAFRNYIDHVMDNYSLRSFTATAMMPARTVSNPDRLTTGAQTQFVLTPQEALRVTAGLDTQRNVHTVRSTSNETTLPYANKPRSRDAKFTQAGAFAEAALTYALGRRLYAGVRIDQWEASDFRNAITLGMAGAAPNPSASRTRASNLASGFVRAEHDLSHVEGTLFAGFGRSQRFPDYWELIKNESTTSVTAFGTAPETTHQFDAGMILRHGEFELSLSAFAAAISDFILVQSSIAKPAGMMGVRQAVVSRNVDAATRGGEAGLIWRFAPGWKADVSLAYVRGDNKTDALPLAQLPPLESRFSLAYEQPRWSVGALVRLAADQHRIAVNQGNIVGQDIGPSVGFAVISLHASWKPTAHTRLSAGVDNLFDQTYAEHISRAGGAVSGFAQTTRINEPGRNLWMQVQVKY